MALSLPNMALSLPNMARSLPNMAGARRRQEEVVGAHAGGRDAPEHDDGGDHDRALAGQRGDGRRHDQRLPQAAAGMEPSPSR
eukprot:2622053-Prymnesium_polylepis.1